MNFKEKVVLFCKSKNLTKPKLAEVLELNYQAMNKNVASNKITMEFIERLRVKFPNEDLNWWIKDEEEGSSLQDPGRNYQRNPMDIINQIEDKLALLKANLTQK